MAVGYSGSTLLVKITNDDSPETFTTIAALRDTTITETESLVDTTNKDSSGVRQLLDGRILSAITVTGTGVFSDDATIASLRTSLRAGTHKNYQIDVVSGASTGGETLEGAFRITSLEEAGTFDGYVNYTLTLESDGTITSS